MNTRPLAAIPSMSSASFASFASSASSSPPAAAVPPVCGRDIAQALHLLAYVCHCAGRDDQARVVLEGLRELAPDYTACLSLLCVARLRACDWQGARTAAERMLADASTLDAEQQRCARRLLAAALRGGGDDAAARAVLEEPC